MPIVRLFLKDELSRGLGEELPQKFMASDAVPLRGDQIELSDGTCYEVTGHRFVYRQWGSLENLTEVVITVKSRGRRLDGGRS